MFRIERHEAIIKEAMGRAERDGVLVVPCNTLSSARAARTHAYAFTRRARKFIEGQEFPEPAAVDVASLAAKVSFTLDGSNLIIRRKDRNEAIMAMEAALGMTVQDPVDAEADASLARIMARMNGEKGADGG